MSQLFTATAHFPKYDPLKSKLAACLETKLPVFSKDTSDDGSKTFFACGYEYFCNVMYRREYMRHVYEVLQMDRPTKIYFDFDQKRDDYETEERFLESFNQFMNSAVDALGEHFGIPVNELVCVVMDASNEKKLSKHVVVQLALESVAAVGECVAWLLTKCACPSLDTGVYTRNRSFRLLYSRKYGDNTTPLLINGITTYDPEHVFMSMIQALVPEHYTGGQFKNEPHVLPVRQFRAPTAPCFKRSRSRDGLTYVSNDSIPPGLLSYVNDMGGAVRSASENIENGFMSMIVSGIYCPYSRSVHKSNNTYFTVSKKNMIGWWTCSDPECPKKQFNKSNLDWIFLEMMITK